MSSVDRTDERIEQEPPEQYELEGMYDDDDEQEQYTIFDPNKNVKTNWVSSLDHLVVPLSEME